MTVKILVGSQMGSAEYVADQLHEQLNNLKIDNELYEHPNSDLLNQLDNTWLFCTSTHGAGELPDNIKDFIEQLQNIESLQEIKYAVIGLGDSSYDRYNQAAKDIDSLLKSKGAQRLIETLEIDAQQQQLPEDIALAWMPQLICKISELDL